MELCRAVQPDGGGQRCIRFDGHEGPHQTFVAEWSNGESVSRRRQPPAQAKVQAYSNRQPDKSRRPQSRPGRTRPPQGGGRSRNRKKR